MKGFSQSSREHFFALAGDPSIESIARSCLKIWWSMPDVTAKGCMLLYLDSSEAPFSHQVETRGLPNKTFSMLFMSQHGNLKETDLFAINHCPKKSTKALEFTLMSKTT